MGSPDNCMFFRQTKAALIEELGGGERGKRRLEEMVDVDDDLPDDKNTTAVIRKVQLPRIRRVLL